MKTHQYLLFFILLSIGITISSACSDDQSQLEEATDQTEEESQEEDEMEEEIPEVEEIEPEPEPEPLPVETMMPEPAPLQQATELPKPKRVWYVIADGTQILSKGDASGTPVRAINRGDKVIGSESGDFIMINNSEWVRKNQLSTKIIRRTTRRARWR